jgi:molybdopterin-guanine dinucleotide biosynthesis protein A
MFGKRKMKLSDKQQTGCAAVILAGGLNSRMGGKNKAFLQLGKQTFLERILENLQPFFSEILLVTRQPELYGEYPLRVVRDIYSARSSLTGIHAGLVQTKAPFCFIVPCDAPFLQASLIRLLLDSLEPSLDVIVPEHEGFYEPLCAIYSKRCIPHIEKQLAREDFKIFHFFKNIRLKTLPFEIIRNADAKLHSFYNVNTPEAYRLSENKLHRPEGSQRKNTCGTFS